MKMLEHWLPPTGSGAAVACLATSFTFDTDFFTDDCLGRFLSITTRDPDGATGLDIAGLLEEEELLSEARVCVLVDQSCRPEPRNLRWDLVPIRVPGGLLHAKVAILIWERAARIVIGSANLTRAGYRNQVELGVAIDLDESCLVPRAVFTDLSAESRSIVGLSPGNAARLGPTRRALEILDLFDTRVAEANLRDTPPQGIKFAIAAAKTATNPLDRLDDVWSGSPPQSVVALSPFWDDREDMPGARAVLTCLAKRASTNERTTATFVVPVDATALTQIVRAPRALRNLAERRIKSTVAAFKGLDDRRLHAKCVQYRSATWLATMFGSSNVSAKGLGLDSAPHREINLWIGCKADSVYDKALRDLIPVGDELSDSLEWAVSADDEDETDLTPLPAGFGEALLSGPTSIELSFTGKSLPKSWKVELASPGSSSSLLLDAETWIAAGRPKIVALELPEGLEQLPSLLEVRWDHDGETQLGMWFVNVGDGSILPPPAELRDLPVDILLSILASTRPLRFAIEHALSRKAHRHDDLRDDLDPLKRFDSSGFLLQRARRSSAALWGIERRVSKPISSMDTLEWRLSGILGPEHLAAKLVEAAQAPGSLDGEAQFLLAELALTVHRIPWASIRGEQDLDAVAGRVRRTLDVIHESAQALDGEALSEPIRQYVSAAFAEVSK